jgi:hypothetical protein
MVESRNKVGFGHWTVNSNCQIKFKSIKLRPRALWREEPILVPGARTIHKKWHRRGEMINGLTICHYLLTVIRRPSYFFPKTGGIEASLPKERRPVVQVILFGRG